MNLKKLGKNQKAAITFYQTYKGWHTFAGRCHHTLRTIESLVKRGVLESLHKTRGIFQARFAETAENK